jgi:membrane dipeptidase
MSRTGLLKELAISFDQRLDRRSMLGASLMGTAFLTTVGAAAPLPTLVSQRAQRVVQGSPVLDMLALPRINLSSSAWSKPLTATERAEFRACGITAMHCSTGTGGPTAKNDTLDFIAGWSGFAGRNSDLFSLIGTIADLDRAKAEGKVGLIMGLQNSDHFDDVKDVELFHGLGQRCSQLTYNEMNRLGAGCTERVDGGVSDYGAAIIAEMNRVGMLVDTSHCGDRTTLDGVALSKGPIAITHSNCRAISHHPRGKTDEAIVALAKKGGVMGISGVRNFVSDHEPTTLGNIVDHIEHVAKLVGVQHVGIGSDADLHGYDALPADQYKRLKESYKSSYGFRDKIDIEGFDHPRKFFTLTDEMLRRGWKDSDISLVLGGNFRRLLGEVWTA